MYTLTDRTQSKPFYIHLLKGYPRTFCRIVVCMDGGIIIDMTEEEHIEGVDIHAGIVVDVGDGEEIFHLLDIEASLFLYLADNSLLACLVVVYKPARQVECPFGGILGTTDDQQFALAVQNEGSRGRTGGSDNR